ncbi:D-alanine--D-alanine ligase [Polynucleobacter sp. IMCC30063]|uniref:D-alanine--D-alanine ligase n=1 Tax=unclassified Polynucleobacter TaxID=2640945 RepID=UPI001F1D6904|nr:MULTISPECIES: D-alanine--D-alanine ligase [unclassified Polynucleobacter]MCE7505048.1 D-alanine--D-alanine ligase [Polynucleobacter sp. IMCC30063]MCE7526160.1 D-alanine--D-alanine ligase [Polynucleobacter sp. IMCC 30228]MCE7528467.1 D-alanine--D-alanine ligase [Polynucleobacter sp. IMCC 29146]
MANSILAKSTWGERVARDLSTLNPQSLGKVGVLLGGRSGEREISLLSGNGVLEALRAKGVDAHAFDTGLRKLTEIATAHFDRVFIALHGRFGEDGTIQGLLELLNIPYTGSGVLASALAIDKIATKRIWMSSGLATPQFELLSASSDWSAVVQNLGLPLIVKPAHEGSSLGLTKVQALEQLPDAYALALSLDKKVMAESCIIGPELTCPLVGEGETAEALPVIQIIPPNANYDFHHKYFSNETQYLCPTELDEKLNQAVQRLALDAYRVLGCKTWGRADIMIDESTRQPYLLEMNTSPGMTSHSLVPMAAKAAGVSYSDLVLWILSQS